MDEGFTLLKSGAFIFLPLTELMCYAAVIAQPGNSLNG